MFHWQKACSNGKENKDDTPSDYFKQSKRDSESGSSCNIGSDNFILNTKHWVARNTTIFDNIQSI